MSVFPVHMSANQRILAFVLIVKKISSKCGVCLHLRSQAFVMPSISRNLILTDFPLQNELQMLTLKQAEP